MNILTRAWRAGTEKLSRTSTNAVLNIFDKIVRRGTDTVVLIYLARSISPEQFGLWSYVTSMWVVLSAFCGLGLQFTTTRAFATAPPATHPRIAANAILLRLLGTIGSGVVLTAYLLGIAHPTGGAALLASIMAIGIIAQAWDTVEHRLQAGDGYPSVVRARLTAAALGIPAKILIIWAGFGAIEYSILNSIEFCVVAALFSRLPANRPMPAWHEITFDGMKALLQQSWPFVGSSIAAAIYMRGDQILLATFKGLESVGLYSAVVRIAEIWHFVPIGIITIWASHIYDQYARDPESARKQVIAAHKVGMRTTAFVVGALVLFADPIVRFCYGTMYEAAVPAIRIYALSSFLVVSGLITWVWMLCEGLEKHCFYQTVFGAAVCMAANLCLIPAFGILGAAIGMVISQVATNLVFHAINRRTRPILTMQLHGL